MSTCRFVNLNCRRHCLPSIIQSSWILTILNSNPNPILLTDKRTGHDPSPNQFSRQEWNGAHSNLNPTCNLTGFMYPNLSSSKLKSKPKDKKHMTTHRETHTTNIKYTCTHNYYIGNLSLYMHVRITLYEKSPEGRRPCTHASSNSCIA